jgi:hypothetical protein
MSFPAPGTLKGMKKTYQGSCHCGAVTFACEIDLAAGTTRCNCKFCRKARFWMTLVPAREFRLVQGAESLADYQRTPPGKDAPFLHFQFCSRCGVRPFTKGGVMPQFGGEFYAVNVACLDDATDDELAAAPVKYVNGRDNDWSHEPAHHYL